MSEEKPEKKKQQKGAKAEGGGKPEGGGKHEGQKHEGQAKGPRPAGGGKREKKPKGSAPQTEVEESGPQEPAPPARLLIHFREKVVPELRQKFGYKNSLAVPRLDKIVISMGVGKLTTAGE